jgi:predicted PurR-regulated permease PerM
MREHSRFELNFFLTIFLGSLVVTFLLFRPVLAALGVAAIFAALLYPMHARIKRMIRIDVISALVSTLIAALLIFVPIGFLMSMLFQEARALSGMLATNGEGGALQDLIRPIEALINTVVPEFSFDVSGILSEAVNWLTRNVGGAFAGTAQLLISLFVGFVAFYYFMKEGPRFLETLISYSPLSDEYDRAILKKLKVTINSIIRGSLAIAVVQGLLTSIGFMIFGVPNPVLWGSLSAVAAVLPAIGPSFIIGPAVVYLIVTGSTPAAIGLLVWGVIAVGLVDNLLLPKFMAHGARIHPLLILASVLGGLHLFGPSGFLLGPLVLGLVYALADIYLELFKTDLVANSAPKLEVVPVDDAGRETGT